MADKKKSSTKTKTTDSGQELAEAGEPYTPEEEREITKRANESANNPDATGQEYEEVK